MLVALLIAQLGLVPMGPLAFPPVGQHALVTSLTQPTRLAAPPCLLAKKTKKKPIKKAAPPAANPRGFGAPAAPAAEFNDHERECLADYETNECVDPAGSGGATGLAPEEFEALKAQGAAAVARRSEVSAKLELSTLKLEGAKAVAQRAERTQALKLALLKLEGAKAVAARAAVTRALKLAILKKEGAAAVAARAERRQALKLVQLRKEGAAAVARRAAIAAAMPAPAARRAPGGASEPPAPEGFEWAGIF